MVDTGKKLPKTMLQILPDYVSISNPPFIRPKKDTIFFLYNWVFKIKFEVVFDLF